MRSLVAVFVLVAIASTSVSEAAVKPEVVQQRYRSVLAELAGGGIAPALEALSALELEAVGEIPTQNRIVSFWKLKLGVIRELLESQPVDVLVPIMMLHHEAYVFYMERRNGVLAGHSRTMATELADIYANRAKTPEAAAVAGWVLTSFGAQLQEFRALRGSTAFYYRALEWDPSNRFARMNIAVNFEKVGEYQSAIEHFELLLESWPEEHAARLRLENCRLRLIESHSPNEFQLGERQKSLTQLQKLARGDGPGWVRAIAYQESTRELLLEKRTEEAEEVLLEGVAAFPEDAQLRVQLLSILERSRRRTEANAVLDSLKASLPAGASARQIYDTYPHTGLQPARDRLLVAMTESVTLLAEDVEETTEGKGS